MASEPAVNAQWWDDASAEFNKIIGPKLPKPPHDRIGKPNWRLLNSIALDPDCFARVLAGYGFTSCVTTVPRGGLKWWQSTDGPTWLMHRQADGRFVTIDRYTGAWRACGSEHRGDDLISLGVFMCDGALSFGQIGMRIAKLLGLEGVPVAHGA